MRAGRYKNEVRKVKGLDTGKYIIEDREKKKVLGQEGT